MSKGVDTRWPNSWIEIEDDMLAACFHEAGTDVQGGRAFRRIHFELGGDLHCAAVATECFHGFEKDRALAPEVGQATDPREVPAVGELGGKTQPDPFALDAEPDWERRTLDGQRVIPSVSKTKGRRVEADTA